MRIDYHDLYVMRLSIEPMYVEIIRIFYAQESPERGFSFDRRSETACPARGTRESLPIESKSNQRCPRRSSHLVFTFSSCTLHRRETGVSESHLFSRSEFFGYTK